MTRNLHQIKSEQTRERLLDAALGLMHAKGHGQLSVHEVARAAGMTSGAVQHHFASKAALMLEVITRVIAQLEDASDFWPPAHWPLAQSLLQLPRLMHSQVLISGLIRNLQQ